MFRDEVRLLKRENDDIARWMPEDDDDIIDKIIESLGVFRVNSFDAQVIRRDLIGMAEEARLRDSNMKEVIGDDIKLTTYDIIKNSRGANKHEVVLLYLKYLFGIAFAMISFFGFTINRTLMWDVNVLGLFSLALSATMFFLLAKLVRPLLNMEGWGRLGFYWTFFTGLSLVNPSWYAAVSTNFLDNPKLFIPGWYVLLISGLLYLVSDYFYRKNINKLAKGESDYYEK
jgi:DNA-binding ferritin-like protein (Dps family)